MEPTVELADRALEPKAGGAPPARSPAATKEKSGYERNSD